MGHTYAKVRMRIRHIIAVDVSSRDTTTMLNCKVVFYFSLLEQGREQRGDADDTHTHSHVILLLIIIF